MSENNSGKLGLALIISVFGLVALTVVTALGRALYDGNLATSVIIAASVVAGTALILWLTIKAKGAENNLKGWQMVEIASIVAYIGLAVGTAAFPLHFFAVMTNSSDLKSAANQDLDALETLIEDFKKQEGEALENTVQGMRNSFDVVNTSTALDKYLSDVRVASDKDADNFEEKWNDNIHDVIVDDSEYASVWANRLSETRKAINSWSLIKIPECINKFNVLGKEIPEKLNEFSENAPFAVITYGDIEADNQSSTYEGEVNFPETIKSLSPYGVVGIIALVFIHLLILFNYFMCSRSRKTSVKGGTDTMGGTRL